MGTGMGSRASTPPAFSFRSGGEGQGEVGEKGKKVSAVTAKRLSQKAALLQGGVNAGAGMTPNGSSLEVNGGSPAPVTAQESLDRLGAGLATGFGEPDLPRGYKLGMAGRNLGGRI